MSDSTLVDDRGDAPRDRGFGLVEVVVSMFLLSLIAMAMIPLLVQGIRISATTAHMATATQLVAQRLDVAKSSATSCAALRNVGTATLAPVVDTNGATYRQTQTVGTCPSIFPALVNYTTSVAVDGTALSNASLRILVTGS